MKFTKILVCLLISFAVFAGAAYAAPTKGKTLVICYSNSGNTKKLTERIVKLKGYDAFYIETQKPYPQSGPDRTQLAKRELENKVYPALKSKTPDLSKYDTLLIGGPVWWYTVSTPMMTFLRDTDFSGKRVAPFITHGGGAGAYFADFAKQARGAKMLPEFEVYRDDVDSISDAEITKWLDSLK